MTKREKRIYVEEMKAIKKKEKSGLKLTNDELWKLTEFYNKTAARNLIMAGVFISISLLMIIVWIVVKQVLLATETKHQSRFRKR